MPPKKSRSKRKSRIILTPWLWVAFFVHLYIAIYYSPLTAAKIVRVTGSEPGDAESIAKILNQVKGIPAMQVRTLKVESEIQLLDAVLTSEYTQNLFGRGLLKVTSKVPVARIVDRPDLALDQNGGLFTSPESGESLVSVVMPEVTVQPTGLVMCGYPRQKIAQLCGLLKNKFKDTAYTLEVSDRGVISLRVPDRATIILGSSDALEEKLQKLREMLDSDPDLYSRNSEVNLTSPNSPMVVPAGG